MKSTIIKKILLIPVLATITLATSLILSNSASAIDCNDPNISQTIKDAAGCSTNSSDPTLKGIITNILNGIIAVSGLIAVIFIIVGGIQYMTSTGDPGKTKKAKDTILYAVIGLIICVLSFAIINFIIAKIS